jgi:hypothetical protein
VTGIFRANNPLNTFLLFVYGILLKFAWLFHPPIPAVQKNHGFLFNNLVSWIKPWFDLYPVSYFIVAYLLLFTQAVNLNQIIMNRRLIEKPNYLPAMTYLLITSLFSECNLLSAPLIINSALIWIFSKMSNLNHNQHPKSTLFNVGMAVGICSFLYLPSIIFGLLIIFSLLYTRPPKAAEWLIILIGVLTPWYFLATFLFLNNTLYSFSLPGFGITYPKIQKIKPEDIGAILAIILTVTGAFFVKMVSSKQIVQVRKNWGYLGFYLLIAIAIPFVNQTYETGQWMFALVPASAFIACVFYYPRRHWIPRVLQWLVVGLVLYLAYFTK